MAKLHAAWICLDCDEVYDGGKRGACPACGSRSGWPLRRWVRPSADICGARLTTAQERTGAEVPA